MPIGFINYPKFYLHLQNPGAQKLTEISVSTHLPEIKFRLVLYILLKGAVSNI